MRGASAIAFWALLFVVGALVAPSARAAIIGTRGPDLLVGTSGDDSLYGQDGDDRVDGGAGNDDVDGGQGADDLRGGPAIDAVTYADSPTGVTLDETANDGAPGGKTTSTPTSKTSMEDPATTT
jgi:Ca2+-binding RTX toxin-like protein